MPKKRRAAKKKASKKKPLTKLVPIFEIKVGDVIYDEATADTAEVLRVGWFGGGKRFPKKMRQADCRKASGGICSVSGDHSFVVPILED